MVLGGVDVVFFLCNSLSLLNDFSLLLVWPFSMDGPVVFRRCHRDLYDVWATSFSDCSLLVVWPLSALTSCFTANLARPFYVQTPDLNVPVYLFGTFATPSMLKVWTCGSGGRCIDCYFFFLLGCSVFSGHCRLSLHVFRLSGLNLCYDRVLPKSCLSTSSVASSTFSMLEVWTCVAIVCWCYHWCVLAWTALFWVFRLGLFFGVAVCCLCDPNTADEVLVFLRRRVSPSLYARGL